jgi:VIT1/CCC1 family predicted Fe2+/Mn2+ transporter
LEGKLPKLAELFFKTAIVFLIVGIGVGLQMSISGAHNVIGAHAHINLLGWVTSAIFGGYYALNPAKAEGRLALTHYGIYTTGVVVMIVSLYFLLLGNTALEPLVAAGSLITFVGVLVFAVVVFGKARASSRATPGTMPAE